MGAANGPPNETTSAPPVRSRERREILPMVASPYARAARVMARRIERYEPQPAFQAGQPIADVGFGGVRLIAQQRRRGHDPAVQAIAALRCLFLDEGRLQHVRVLRRAEAGEGDDPGGADGGNRQ